LEKSLASSILLTENEPDDDEGTEQESPDDLGIQSIEELFKNIFSNMNISVQNFLIYVTDGKDGEQLLLEVPLLSLSSEGDQSPEKVKGKEQKNSKKFARFETLNVKLLDKDSTATQTLLSLSREEGENLIEIKYYTNEESDLVRLETFLNFEGSLLHAKLDDAQLAILRRFFSTLEDSPEQIKEPKLDVSGSTTVQSLSASKLKWMEESIYSSVSELSPLDALQKSILNIGPYESLYLSVNPPPPSVTPSKMDFLAKLFISKLNCTLLGPSQFSFDAHEIFLSYKKLENRSNIDFNLGSFSLSEIPNKGQLENLQIAPEKEINSLFFLLLFFSNNSFAAIQIEGHAKRFASQAKVEGFTRIDQSTRLEKKKKEKTINEKHELTPI
jgi:hypothetical protein